MIPRFSSRSWFAILAVTVLYIALGTGRALTTLPWNDEAWYTSPSWSLIHHGNTGTAHLEAVGHFCRGINEWTYWVVPLQLFAQVPWFKLFGAGLLSARFFAMAWGLVALFSWGLIIRKLTGDAAMGFWTMAMMTFDYQFVSQMSLNRMDAMALGLASLGILSFVELREKNLLLAVGVSQACVVACGLTHPTAGVPALVAVTFLTLYFDRARIGVKHVALASVPFLVGAAGWYAYISIAPDLFKAQFFGNVVDIDRLGGFHHPLQAIVREIGRYWGMAGHEPGMAKLYAIKTLVILVYLVAALSLAFNEETRKDPKIRPVLWLLLVYVITMTFYDNTKEVKYAVHMVPLYDAVTAIWLVFCWRKGGKWRWIGAGATGAAAAVGVLGLLYTAVVKDSYHHDYLPVANYLDTHAQKSDLILAGSEFGFALGFDRNIDDDDRFTYVTHKTPKFIVLSPNYKLGIEHEHRTDPQYAFIQKMFAEDYREVYSVDGYDILQRRD